MKRFMSNPHGTLKQRVAHEMRNYFLLALFLMLFSAVFTIYQQLLIDHFDLNVVRQGFGIIESLVLAKIIMIGQFLHLGEGYEKRSLIIPTLYKTFIFSLFVFAFGVLEHFVLGYFHHKTFETTYQELISKGLPIILGKVLIKSFVFLFLFAFLEIGRFMGEDKLFDLFFRRKG